MFSHILSLCRDPMPAPYFLSCLLPQTLSWSLVKGLAFLELVPLSQKLYLHLPNVKGKRASVFKVNTRVGYFSWQFGESQVSENDRRNNHCNGGSS